MSPVVHRPRRSPTARLGILIAGWALLGLGAVLLFLPGPGLATLLLGLAVLGKEAPWAHRAEVRVRAWVRRRLHPREPAPSVRSVME